MLSLLSLYRKTNKRHPVFITVVLITSVGVLYTGTHLYKTAKLYFNIQKARTEKLALLEAHKTKQQRTLDDMAVLFPDALRSSKECYQSALSNYIEDHWNRLAGEHGCFSDSRLCEKSREDNLTTQANRQHYLEDPVPEQILIESANASLLAGALSRYTQPLYLFFKEGIQQDVIVDYSEAETVRQKTKTDPLSFMEPPQNQKLASEDIHNRVKELDKYIGSCETLKPMGWLLAGEAIPSSSSAAAMMKLSEYSKLLTNVIGHKLTPSENTLVKCLLTLNEVRSANDTCEKNPSCLSKQPTETKEELLKQLNELAKHECSISYALRMAGKMSEPSPVSFKLNY